MPQVDRKGPSRPTIRAIADMAGVSRTTVSLVLANRQDMVDRFRPDTFYKLRQAAKAVGNGAKIWAKRKRALAKWGFF